MRFGTIDDLQNDGTEGDEGRYLVVVVVVFWVGLSLGFRADRWLAVSDEPRISLTLFAVEMACRVPKPRERAVHEHIRSCMYVYEGEIPALMSPRYVTRHVCVRGRLIADRWWM